MADPFADLLTDRDVADKRNISVITLRRERRIGGGPPFVKIGRQVYYPAEAYSAWIGQNIVTSSAELEARKREVA